MNTSFDLFGVECRSGWKKIIEPLFELCATEKVQVLQVKEKFGGLRFYVGAASEEVHAAIEKAENDSFTICEYCGDPGLRRGGGWLKTLCYNHYKEEVDAGRRNPTVAHSGTESGGVS